MSRGATRHTPSDPQGFTLATMAKAAREAGETWTMRQWAARLAAQAEPRDYAGQLGALFRGIVERWRYVQEPGEIVTGSGRAVLAHTLGLGHYPGVDPERVDVGGLPLDPRRRGFGDCDDVATLTAAGVWALGMRPAFRVVQSPRGAHVSVTATTPTGERVELDPVGHPDHGPGWALEGPGLEVTRYDVGDPQGGLSGSEPMAAEAFETDTDEAHYVAGARPGPRVLVIPDHLMRQWIHPGAVVDGTRAVDQDGDEFGYDAACDLWVPARNLGALNRGERVARRRRVVRRVRQRFAPVAAAARKVGARVLASQTVQQAIASSLAVTGTPVPVTLAMLRAASGVLAQGGLVKLLRLARKNPKEAAALLARAVARGRGGFGCLGCVECGGTCGGALGGWADGPRTPTVLLEHGNLPRLIPASPVRAIVGLPFLPSFGSLDIAAKPRAGSWYRVREGDSLLTIARAAFGDAGDLPGSQWIAAAAANSYARREPANTFEQQHYPGGLPSLTPRWAADETAAKGARGSSYPLLWIPPGPGIEPPRDPDAPPAPVPDAPPPPVPPGPVPPPMPPPPGPPAPPSSNLGPLVLLAAVAGAL